VCLLSPKSKLKVVVWENNNEAKKEWGNEMNKEVRWPKLELCHGFKNWTYNLEHENDKMRGCLIVRL
jgi:hypothetical protein